MPQENELESIDIPGIGEVRARPGTSTIELAGAAKHWFDKHQALLNRIDTSRREGFIGGVFFSGISFAVTFAIYYLWT